MTREKALEIEERMGGEINYDKLPPALEDFPYIVPMGQEVFNSLSDRYVSNSESIIFVGKDYSSFGMFCELLGVPDDLKYDVLEVVQYLDSKARAKAAKEARKSSK